ncbi:unnamed protein product [Cuscuta epithymum]|uniref:Uncharacterized protein n=1 Tax=Cuscuta epithymum TaxID=186058 RepID=A0AAV0FIG6_9ASTE|nr:unnamed protein product [Cuscuta epithymum]
MWKAAHKIGFWGLWYSTLNNPTKSYIWKGLTTVKHIFDNRENCQIDPHTILKKLIKSSYFENTQSNPHTIKKCSVMPFCW